MVNRGITYALDMQCTPAMEDARGGPGHGAGHRKRDPHRRAGQRHPCRVLRPTGKPPPGPPARRRSPGDRQQTTGTETATWRPSTLPGTRSRPSWTATCGPRTCSSNRPCPISTRAWSFSRRATTQRPSRASRPPGKPTALPLGPSRPW